MFYQVSKTTLRITTLTLLLFFVSFVAPERAFAAACGLGDPPADDPAAHLLKIVCPIENGLNVLVLSSGAIFVIVILYGAFMLSISQGDAKAIQAARAMLTWGVIGFLAIISVYTIFNITAGIFGIDTGLLPTLDTGIQGILNWLKN